MKAILERRSIRKYTDQPVTEEQITQILKAGMAAPSAGSQYPWHFIVLDDKEIIEKITTVHPYSHMLKQVQYAIVVCGDLSLEKYKGFWLQDCCAATENMLIAAQEMGLGSVWLGVYPLEDRTEGIKALLSLPENVIPLSILPIGYPAETKSAPDHYDPSRIHKNQW